jgi:murein DD-endopeptidase MepM/ murein hydrolase activator NlpD
MRRSSQTEGADRERCDRNVDNPDFIHIPAITALRSGLDRHAQIMRIGVLLVLVPALIATALLNAGSMPRGDSSSDRSSYRSGAGIPSAWTRAASAGIEPYRAPLVETLRIVRTFQAPLSAYGAGHRGVDLAARPGEPVLAAGTGRVSFAGSVGGRGVVVIAHAGAISTEYEPVRASVRIGESVPAGQIIGVLSGSGCAPASCLHWGAKHDGVYFDPLTLLRPLGPVRLLPLTGQYP